MKEAEAGGVRRRLEISRSTRSFVPNASEASLVVGSALLTVLSFPDFDLWFLAWIGLAPFLFVIVRAHTASRAFVAGWLWGIIFFYGTCWWLTYPMIHFAGISRWLAYPLLLLPVMLGALFPALFAGLLSRIIQRFGDWAIVLAPLIWVSTELLRYAVTGQLWNAIGYSQAFHPLLIQTANKGGVYAVTSLIIVTNATAAFALARFTLRSLIASASILVLVALLILLSRPQSAFDERITDVRQTTLVVAVQPNVPMTDVGADGFSHLLDRHVRLSDTAFLDDYLRGLERRLVIWPESPMNFTYSHDPHLRQVIGDFARANHTSVLLNSLEPAQNGGDQNSAILVNEKGEMSARYDKIRLMPFGEYVPLPQWLPGASSVRGIVGEFKPGSSYTLMPLGALRAGVFICIEAAHPGVARSFTNEGADVLINISNDGYLGPTPVMRQHLSNAIFRAVENDRDLIRVTNTGITAYIGADGTVADETGEFQEAVRTWTISKRADGSTFYTRHGDVFAYGCALITLAFASASFVKRRIGTQASGQLALDNESTPGGARTQKN